MRAGLSTIQQTLMPEVTTVLNQSIAEAGRRNHSQTTPLHVAATLLASPSGFLRQACIRSHPNSSHPLQCRALELCFSVALERLPTSQNSSPGVEPPISNALMAALKRAQAHQRRGCPEQQQQPLLAVKVELDQLIISILDDPSVSRVMREASFSSPAVKASIEQSLNAKTTVQSSSGTAASIGLGFRSPVMAPAIPSRNLYMNPRLQQQGSPATQSGQQQRSGEEAKKVIDVLTRSKKRNPVLVGDSDPDSVVKEVLKKIENKEIENGILKNVEVIHLQIPFKVIELGIMIDARISKAGNCGGVILDLGDLKWLVEQPVVNLAISAGSAPPQQQVISDVGCVAVMEMGKLLKKFDENSAYRVWLIGTATCETYLRCQVYHPKMENDWDLQAVPITARAPLPGMFTRAGNNATRNSSLSESLTTTLKAFPSPTPVLARRLTENSDNVKKASCCPQCTESYEQELVKLVAKESELSSSEPKSEAPRPSPTLPLWMQNAKASNNTDQSQSKDQELIMKHQTQELKKKWNNTCLRLHPSFHKNVASERIAPPALAMTGLCNKNLLGRQAFQPKLNLTPRTLGDRTLQLNPNVVAVQPRLSLERAASPPRIPVMTDLALGQTNNTKNTPEERTKDFMGCIAPEPLQNIKLMTSLEADFVDSFKKLLKGLNDKVWWQQDAASAVATTVTQCKLGNGKRRGGTSGSMWLLFTGPDRVGKRKAAYVLSEQVGGDYPVMISLGSKRDYEQSNTNIRGKTVLDRIAEAVKRNPFSVIMLEDIDEADMLIRGSIKRAMERGRLADSHGREISLGNVIFILTTNWLPDNLKTISKNPFIEEEKLAKSASGGWQLKLAVTEKSRKRRVNWLDDEDRSTKPRKNNSLSFDLNEVAEDGSRNSSDLTVDHETDYNGLINSISPTASLSRELLNLVDESILFKSVDSEPVRLKFGSYISETFSTVIDHKLSLEVESEALEKILGGVWLGRVGLEEYTEKYLVPIFRQLKMRLLSLNAIASNETMNVRLELDDSSGIRNLGDWLPNKINLVVNE